MTNTAANRLTFRGEGPTVADSALVSARAYLVGSVTVGDRASVWPFACARGDGAPVRIGAESNVQEFTMLHGATLGDRVAVGHGAVVDHATVEGDALVGIRSTVLQDATVEAGCLVAAGAVVRAGQTVPSGHMAFGVPAETRPLTDGQRSAIEGAVDHYLELADEYQAAGGFE